MKKFTIFKTPQEEDVQVVAPFETKKKQHPKKKLVKEEDEVMEKVTFQPLQKKFAPFQT
jgi:hypothetical protein